MTYMVDRAGARATHGGISVTKTITETTNGAQDLFDITGQVVIRAIIGGVLLVPFGATATSISLRHDPTTGSAVDLCGPTVVTSDAAGTLYSYLGDSSASLLVSSGTAVPNQAYTTLPTVEQVFTAGTIEYVGTAINTGWTLWTCMYWPLDAAGGVTAA